MNRFLRSYWNVVFKLTRIDVSYDARYSDWSFYSLEFKADYQAVENILAERHLAPKETAPNETSLQIVGCQMRAVQVSGPYNEVSIQVPVTPLGDAPGDTFAHLYLPVNTEAARWPGVDIYGFPKFIAAIAIEKHSDQVTCRLAEKDELILEFSVRDRMGAQKQARWEYYGSRNKQIIKTIFDLEGKIFEGTIDDNGVDFALGTHRIANEVKKLLKSDEVVKIVIGNELSGILRKPVPVMKGLRVGP